MYSMYSLNERIHTIHAFITFLNLSLPSLPLLNRHFRMFMTFSPCSTDDTRWVWLYFLQVVWKDSTSIGCAISQGCSDGTYVACDYGPGWVVRNVNQEWSAKSLREWSAKSLKIIFGICHISPPISSWYHLQLIGVLVPEITLEWPRKCPPGITFPNIIIVSN